MKKLFCLALLLCLSACGCNDTQEGCWFIGHPFRSETPYEKAVHNLPSGTCNDTNEDWPGVPKCQRGK